MRYICLLLLMGCAAVPSRPDGVCVSPCGVTLVGSNKCAELAEHEARIITVFAAYTDRYICRALDGLSLEIEPKADYSGLWTDEFGRKVFGLTYCTPKLMKIGVDDFKRSSLAHEVIHSGIECPWENVDHEGAAWAQPDPKKPETWGWYWWAMYEVNK